MIRTTWSKHIDAFRSETQMLLRFQLAFDRIVKFNDFHDITRSDLVDKIIALKAIENDIIMRICKFDDGSRGVHSFKNALREIPDTHLNKSQILDKIGVFQRGIRKVKEIRRHTELAHLKVGSFDNEYEPTYDLRPAIILIVDILDLMNIERINYKWSDGKYEKYDLRVEVIINKTDNN